MTRRGRGEGSIYWDADRGRYVGAVSYSDPDTGRRIRRKVSARTREELKDKLDALKQEKRTAGTVARRDTSTAQVVQDFLANLPPEIRSPVSVACHRNCGNRIIEALGRIQVTKLTPAQVERFLNGMARDGYATSTISMTRSVLVRSIRRAQRDGLAGRNVAELVPCPRGTRRESRSMTLAQVEMLLTAELSQWWRAYLYTGIMCGLRPGELLGLRWEDVDTAAGVIRVRKSIKVTEHAGRMVLSLEDLKTERSRRTLEMPKAVASMLAGLRKEQAAARLAAGPAYTDMGLVFARADGTPARPTTVRHSFRRICEQAGLGDDWHPHEQRHSFVSILSDAGVDIDQIADAAGHINSNVTKTVYRHQLADKISTVARVMDSTFRTAGGAS
jgi:integrase